MSLSAKYKRSLTHQWCMHFRTSHPDGDCYDGVVVHIGSDFIALREEEAFEFDALQILQIDFITGYRDDRFDRCCNEILRENGQIKYAKAPKWLLSCETVYDVLAHCHKKDVWPAVEVIDPEHGGVLYLGPIAEVSTEALRLKCYDADGRWEKTYRVNQEDIVRIELDSKYCKHFNTYMRRKTPDR